MIAFCPGEGFVIKKVIGIVLLCDGVSIGKMRMQCQGKKMLLAKRKIIANGTNG
jgi:hypothetical protein